MVTAVSSSARNCGAQVTDILAVARWSSERTFAKHYDKQISADNVIQGYVLPKDKCILLFVILILCWNSYNIEPNNISQKSSSVGHFFLSQLIFSIKL